MNGKNVTRYSDYGNYRECAVDIARECILEGKSEFWQGSKEEVEAVSQILNPLNIFYVLDFYGRWAVVNPQNK